MLALDVNVLVSAWHEGAVDHLQMRQWLEDAVAGPQPVGVSDAVVVGAVRVLTHPKVFDPPVPTKDALDLVEQFLAHPNVQILPTTRGQWRQTREFCMVAAARGNLVPDAAHAAHAHAHRATFITKDRGFARFPGLQWQVPALDH